MTYIKLLTALTALALLTACGGGAAAPADKTGGDTTSDDPCVTNPFGTTCTNPTETQRVTFCRDEGKTTDTKTDDCAPTVRLVCTANVFDDLCTAPTQQEAEAFCGDASKTTATKTNDCADTITTACTANFRHTLCDDIKEYEDMRDVADNSCLTRTGSQTACDEEARIATCDANEFATNCPEQTYVDERQTACLANIQIDDSCRGTTGIATLFCAGTPFNTSPACVADTGAIALRESRCLASATAHPSCGGILTTYCETNPTESQCVVDTADWLASPAGTGLATAPVSTHTANQFLSGLTATLPTFPSDFTLGSGDRATSLTLADNGFGGDATDGASFFWGTFGSTGRYYAGIHASTDLGAPLDNISQAGIWKGWFRLDVSLEGRSDSFDLTVTFNTASQGGTIAAFFSPQSNVFLDIDGTFNDKGVIMGTTVLGPSSDQAIIAVSDFRTPGILTGLIGQQGAVGAFFSTTNTLNNNDMLGNSPYTGAFVAVQPPPPPPPDPCVKAETCVNTADWLGSFTGNDALPTTPDATPKNEFLAITAMTASSLTDVVPTTLFMTGSTTNGLAFFRENSRFYAGILAGTNLGAPITETITSARWTGQIRAVSSGTSGVLTANPTAGFGLDITFDGRGGTMKTIAIVPTVNTVYEIDGMFDANGIISGDVILSGSKEVGGNRVVDTSHAFYSPGTLSGIIGQNGAVGVFHSGHETLIAGAAAPSFGGGFVVTPPTQ